MRPSWFRRLHPSRAAVVFVLLVLSSRLAAQSPGADMGVEEIRILRSLRVSRTTPTDFCAPTRTGYAEAAAEDRLEFRAVATEGATGRVTNAHGALSGTARACFGPTSDPQVVSFYAEGEIAAVPFTGRGQCRTTKRDYPEAGIAVAACHLDLTGLPTGYVGGQLTANSLATRLLVGSESDPPGYTQPSIATIRLWKERRER